MNEKAQRPASHWNYESDVCQAQGWTHDDGEVTCDLPAGHEGVHVDSWEGWQWPSPRVLSPGGPDA